MYLKNITAQITAVQTWIFNHPSSMKLKTDLFIEMIANDAWTKVISEYYFDIIIKLAITLHNFLLHLSHDAKISFSKSFWWKFAIFSSVNIDSVEKSVCRWYDIR